VANVDAIITVVGANESAILNYAFASCPLKEVILISSNWTAAKKLRIASVFFLHSIQFTGEMRTTKPCCANNRA